MAPDSIFKNTKVNSLWNHIKNNTGNEYVFFSKEDKEKQCLLFCVCDGYNVFQHEFTPAQDFSLYLKEANCESSEEFFTKISLAASNDNIDIQEVAESINVCFKADNSSFNLVCYPTTAIERKTLYSHLFFNMAAKLKDLEKENKNLSQKVDRLEGDYANNVSTTLSNTDDVIDGEFKNQSRTSTLTTSRKKIGGSIINPGSKRKKKATGVVFDDD